MTTEKALAKVEKDKKDRYLQECLESRSHFTPFIFSADGFPGKEAQNATREMASHFSLKLKREYSEMCGFMQVKMALAVAQYNTLLLGGNRDKEARIINHPDLSDGVLMALLVPWWG